MTQDEISITSSTFGGNCRPQLVIGPPPPCPSSIRGLAWPIPTNRPILITQGYKAGHQAIDIVYRDSGILDIGTPILAPAIGVVTSVGMDPDSECGLGLAIDHVQNVSQNVQLRFTTHYCHLSNVVVRVGDVVGAGDVLGMSGDTGLSTGPHLHFYIELSPISTTQPPGRIDPCTVLPDLPGSLFHLRDDGSVAPGCSETTGPQGCVAPPASSPGAQEMVNLICSMFTSAGATNQQANLAVAIAAAESGLDPAARNVNTGFNPCRCQFECRNEDWGLFQINLRCHADKLRQLGIISTSEDLFDPVRNIASAILISGAGRDWTSWASYNAGTYLRYYGQPGYTCV